MRKLFLIVLASASLVACNSADPENEAQEKQQCESQQPGIVNESCA